MNSHFHASHALPYHQIMLSIFGCLKAMWAFLCSLHVPWQKKYHGIWWNMPSFKVNKHVICDKQVMTHFLETFSSTFGETDWCFTNDSVTLHRDHTNMHSELQSHLPGDKVLQFLYFLKVLWVFLHVLIIEEGLGKRERRYWGKYVWGERGSKFRGRLKKQSEMWWSLRYKKPEKQGKKKPDESRGKALGGAVKMRKILSRHPLSSNTCTISLRWRSDLRAKNSRRSPSDSYCTVSQDQYESIPGRDIFAGKPTGYHFFYHQTQGKKNFPFHMSHFCVAANRVWSSQTQ